jgi:hypothetical protein
VRTSNTDDHVGTLQLILPPYSSKPTGSNAPQIVHNSKKGLCRRADKPRLKSGLSVMVAISRASFKRARAASISIAASAA